MGWLLLACFSVVLIAGAFQGPAPRRAPCDCQRCWYVGDPPEGTRSCSRVIGVLAFGAVAFLALAFLGKRRTGLYDTSTFGGSS